MNAHHALKVPSRLKNPTRADRIVVDLNYLEDRGEVRSWFVRTEPGKGRRWVIEVSRVGTMVVGTAEAERLVARLLGTNGRSDLEPTR